MIKNKADVRVINHAIHELEIVKSRLEKGQLWSAYKGAAAVCRILFSVKRSCAERSVMAAMDWGNAIRLPDGRVGILKG